MKVLNFGSLNIDHVYTVEHLVNPGETIASQKLEFFCGGKGLNQSIALSRAGAKVYHAGKIGSDGEILKTQLQKNGVNTDLIRKSDCLSGHAIIQVDSSGQNSIILHGGANYDIDSLYVDQVLDSFHKGDIILLQNEISCMEYIVLKAHQKGLLIALNPSPMNEIIHALPLENVEWFILNELEGQAITGLKSPEEIAAKLMERFPDSRVVLTLNKNGVLYQDREQFLKHDIYKVDVVDTTAAGDTFTGYFLACISEGIPIDVAIEKASIAAALAVSVKGASNSIPDRRSVDAIRFITNNNSLM